MAHLTPGTSAACGGKRRCFLPDERFTAGLPVRCGMLSRILAACTFALPMRIDRGRATAERYCGAFNRGVEPTHDPG